MPETQPTRTRREFTDPATAATPADDWTLPAEPLRRRPAHGHQPVLIKRRTGKRRQPASAAADNPQATGPDD